MPISVGDEIALADSGRAEVGLADGQRPLRRRRNAGAVRLAPRPAGRGRRVLDGRASRRAPLILAALGRRRPRRSRASTRTTPRVYLNPGARARVNYDSEPRHGRHRARRNDRGPHARRQLPRARRRVPHGPRRGGARDRAAARSRATGSTLWAADRFDVGDRDAQRLGAVRRRGIRGDVVALDGYGNWDYNDTYGSNVWRPASATDWTPYSNGTWYYTPAGLTWWSYDPWGWYPFHYGNWFFDASLVSSWCWAPAYVYSPAWVYWAYSARLRRLVPGRLVLLLLALVQQLLPAVGLDGAAAASTSRSTARFNSRNVDFRGWNFAGSGGFGAAGRMDVIPGSRMGGRLGTPSRSPRGRSSRRRAPAQAREAVQSFVREAPRVIDRSSSAADSSACLRSWRGTARSPRPPSTRCATMPSSPTAAGWPAPAPRASRRAAPSWIAGGRSIRSDRRPRSRARTRAGARSLHAPSSAATRTASRPGPPPVERRVGLLAQLAAPRLRLRRARHRIPEPEPAPRPATAGAPARLSGDSPAAPRRHPRDEPLAFDRGLALPLVDSARAPRGRRLRSQPARSSGSGRRHADARRGAPLRIRSAPPRRLLAQASPPPRGEVRSAPAPRSEVRSAPAPRSAPLRPRGRRPLPTAATVPDRRAPLLVAAPSGAALFLRPRPSRAARIPAAF